MPHALTRSARPRAGAPLRRAARLLALLLPMALLPMALLPVACATVERTPVSIDESAQRSVTILTGTPPVAQRAEDFARLSSLDVEASLRRLVVRPSKTLSFLRGDPQPLLDADQLPWARDAIASHLPALKRDQRLLLTFLDRFNQYPVEVEVYASERALTYRFVKLADVPEGVNPDPGAIKVQYAELVAQPGQQLEDDARVYTLSDPVFGREGRETLLVAHEALIQQALASGSATEAQLAPLRAWVTEHPQIGSEAVRLYLDKLGTLNKAETQNLLSAQEAATRRETLIKDLQQSAAQ